MNRLIQSSAVVPNIYSVILKTAGFD